MPSHFARNLLLVLIALVARSPAFSQVREDFDSESVEPQQAVAAELPNPSDVLRAIVAGTNDFRREEQLTRVQTNDRLQAAAQYFADYMAEHDLFGHTADKKRLTERAAEYKYDFCVVSENIAYRFTTQDRNAAEIADTFVVGWKISTGHRTNMLDPDVLEIGVGIAQSKKSGYVYAVQMFGRPKSASIDFTLRNRAIAPLFYRIGDQHFELPPGYARTHHQCRPPKVEFLDSADAKSPLETLKPTKGQQLTASHSQQGWRVSAD